MLKIRPSRKIINVEISSIKKIHNNNQLVFEFFNPGLLTHKRLVKSLFKILKSNKEFKEFGRRKTIIIQAIINGQERSFSENVLINNQTNFKSYYNVVKDLIVKNFDEGYAFDVINEFKVRVWNMNNIKNKQIKLTRNAIKIRSKPSLKIFTATPASSSPLPFGRTGKRCYSTNIDSNNLRFISPLKPPKSVKPSNFMAMDIETISLNDIQIPILISISKQDENKLFVIDHDLLKIDQDLANFNLWKNFFNYLNKQSNKIIFVHNLGKFDGVFIYKNLLKHYNVKLIKTIIDKNNCFVTISIKIGEIQIIFKDSFRIFPVSLNELSKVFNVQGKIGSYKSEYNSINIFENVKLFAELKNYSLQDSISLFNSLLKAQKIYINKYNVDFTSIVSTSTLSFKIFRQNFLNVEIPILNKEIDSFIRKSYFGGASDYYRAYGKNLYYYDVNSLYPFAMLNLMPLKILNFYKDLRGFTLENFFGFVKAEITTPKNLVYPLLPFKKDGLTIHPLGKFTGFYFTEELKAVKAQGYKIKLIEGYEFSKTSLFEGFINKFFEQKRNTLGAERLIAKLHLNTLYGFFGQTLEKLKTLIIQNKDFNEILKTKSIKNCYGIDEEYSALVIRNDFTENCNIQSNVALASAVTSYARIEMLKIKIYCLKKNIKIFYTDTDSLIVDKPLPSKMIGKDIGLLKDELSGKIIEEAIFLGIKQYGYYYFENGVKQEKSVFAGVARDSLTFKEIQSLLKGAIITKIIHNRFFKSLNTMNIKIASTKISIQRSKSKLLIRNIYKPKIL